MIGVEPLIFLPLVLEPMRIEDKREINQNPIFLLTKSKKETIIC